MSRNRAERSRALDFFGGLSAFVLSAALGVAFVGLVVKTHNLFACATFPGPTVIGTWQGQLHDLPAVTLTISREGEQLTGTVLFQPVVKTEQGARPAGTPVTVTLKDAWFDGKTLRFKLDDSRAARELRESGIEMTLTNADHAQLRLAACSYDGGPKCEEVALTRTA